MNVGSGSADPRVLRAVKGDVAHISRMPNHRPQQLKSAHPPVTAASGKAPAAGTGKRREDETSPCFRRHPTIGGARINVDFPRKGNTGRIERAAWPAIQRSAGENYQGRVRASHSLSSTTINPAVRWAWIKYPRGDDGAGIVVSRVSPESEDALAPKSLPALPVLPIARLPEAAGTQVGQHSRAWAASRVRIAAAKCDRKKRKAARRRHADRIHEAFPSDCRE